MKSIGAIAIVLFAIVVPREGVAQALGVDWKLYGGDTTGGVSLCFYDAHSVVRGPEDHIRVWVKCLSQKDMEAIDLSESSVEKSAKRLAGGYVPPIVVAGKMDSDQTVAITSYEEVANTGRAKPLASIFYELSCSERRLRELSIHVHAKGKSGSSDKPRDWKYILPEGNAANLLKILCHA